MTPPVDPPPTTTTTTTLPGGTTTITLPGVTTTVPDSGEPDAALACAAFADQAAAQAAYDGYIDAYNGLGAVQPIFGPALLALADGLDTNGNGTACEDFAYA